jgi:PadR family transcriptional regulator PadR
MLARELVAASAEPLILSLLSKGESYGYAIIQEIKQDGKKALKQQCEHWMMVHSVLASLQKEQYV